MKTYPPLIISIRVDGQPQSAGKTTALRVIGDAMAKAGYNVCFADSPSEPARDYSPMVSEDQHYVSPQDAFISVTYDAP